MENIIREIQSLRAEVRTLREKVIELEKKQSECRQQPAYYDSPYDVMLSDNLQKRRKP